MPRITDVVKHLLIINVIAFFASNLLGQPIGGVPQELADWGRLRFAMFYPASDFFRPYQIVSHMFMHADFGHLFFNMFALFMFGPPLESLWGPKRFLFFYLFTGFGALALYNLVRYVELLQIAGDPGYWMINTPMLGASGAVFGLLAGFGMKFPDARLMLIFPPIPMKAKYFVMIYAGVELFLGLSPFSTGVAHFAHVGGALFGALIIWYWQKNPKRMQ